MTAEESMMTANPVPPGYHAVTPYLLVRDPGEVIEFAKRTFGAEERTKQEEGGRILHAEIVIGDSAIMLGSSRKEYPPMPAMLYVYVADVDAVYARALAAGATSLREPVDEAYGDRAAGLRDSQGVQWWIATRMARVTPKT